ncbi:MAG TPA: DUF86 domain-containing protein [Methanocorpusculum sp.]|nr:DUF86 domain-containing protein [Methanocorpusculum sp.]
MKSDAFLIEDIRTEVYFIIENLPDLTRDVLIEDKLYRNAFLRSIEVIGEAAKRLSDEFKERNPDFPVQEMARTRDKMIHGYDEINYDLLWEILTRDIPKTQILLQNIRL